MQQQQYEARASREASKTVRIHRCRWKYSSATNSNDKNLSQGSFTKQQHWGDKVSREAERQRNGESSSGESMRTCKARMWRQLVKQTVLQGPAFRFCEFPSLRTTPWISRRTLSEEHAPWWAQIYTIHRNQRPKWHNLERGYCLPSFFLQFPYISTNRCPSLTCLVLPGSLRWLIHS